jgi:hypothetical protein
MFRIGSKVWKTASQLVCIARTCPAHSTAFAASASFGSCAILVCIRLLSDFLKVGVEIAHLWFWLAAKIRARASCAILFSRARFWDHRYGIFSMHTHRLQFGSFISPTWSSQMTSIVGVNFVEGLRLR